MVQSIDSFGAFPGCPETRIINAIFGTAIATLDVIWNWAQGVSRELSVRCPATRRVISAVTLSLTSVIDYPTVTIMQSDQKLAYTVNAAAAALDISRSKMYDLMKQGNISFICIGSVRRIPYSEIVRVSTNGIPGTPSRLRLVGGMHSTRQRLKP
jgi:excisionase family DNA binding protein